ncbi:MAG: hemolysin family protein [Pseudomonadota bacterium]
MTAGDASAPAAVAADEPGEPFWRRLRDRLIRRRGADAEATALRDLFDARHAELDEQTAAHERALVTNILKLRDMTAYDVMVPRAHIVAAPEDVTLTALLKTLAEKPHSRLPIYRETLDDAIGMVHIKDTLALAAESAARRGFSVAKILRPLPFIAPSTPVVDLLDQMRRDRVHMALVIDEYGGVDGLVTIEDLVETIDGEIADEHDAEDAPAPLRAPDGGVIVDARLEIKEFEAAFGAILDDEDRAEDIDTMGGLVFYQAGRVPGRGELIRYGETVSFEILDADPRRVRRIKVHGLPTPNSVAA